MFLEKKQYDLQYPILHLNGSGEHNLLEGYNKAYTALMDAIQAIAQTTPHMRDYYVSPTAANDYNAAIAQHNTRIAALQRIQAEFEQLAGNVSHQQSERDARKAG